MKVRNTPIWAAAPSKTSFGFDSIVEKSVIAPMPRKIKRRKHTLADAEVDVIQHAAFVVRTQRHALDHGDVPHDHAEANRQQQQRLVVFDDRQRDEHDADHDHRDVADREVEKAGRIEELLEDLHQKPFQVTRLLKRSSLRGRSLVVAGAIGRDPMRQPSPPP